MSGRRFLPSLRAAPEPPAQRKSAVDRRHSAGPNYAFTGTPYTPITDMELDRTIRDHYERDVWVWRACDARAKNSAGIDVVVKRGRGRSGKKIEGHPLAALLNGQANPYEAALFFRWRFQLLLDLSVAKGVFVEVTEGRGNIVDRVDLLNPLHTWPVPDPDTFVSRFEMRTPQGEVFDKLLPYKRGRGGVLWFRRPHPTDPYQSNSWIRAAGLSIDLDYWARRYNLNFLYNDGRPGGVLGIKSGATEDGEFEGIDPMDAAILQQRMSGGPDAAGRIAVIEADHLEFHDLSQSPRDAQYVEGRAITQREILVAAGTPLSVIGDASGRTYDNADAEARNFWKKEMRPELRLQANTWETLTPGGLADESEVVDYDWSMIDELAYDERQRDAALQAEVDGGTRTIDSYLEETGREPMNLPGTRVLWFSTGKAPIGDEADVTALLTQGQSQAPPPALPPGEVGQPALPPGGGGDPADQEILDAELVDPLDETQYAVKALRSLPAGLADRRRAEHAALIDRWTADVAAEVRGMLNRQQRIVLTRLKGAKARRHTRHWTYATPPTGGLKALDAQYILERRSWVDTAINLLVDVVSAAFGAAGDSTAKALDGPEFDPAVGNDVVARTVRLIAEGLDARAGRLQDIITAADAAGDTVEEIAAKVTDAYGSVDTWADVTSRSVVGAMNAASLIAATRSGAVAKRWLATDDERTRPTHHKAEGQVVPIGSTFTVGEAALLFPHDPTGPAGEVINCRCTMLFALPPADPGADLDADLADMDAFDATGQTEWKAARIGGFSGVTVEFDPTDHPRDYRGRFLDVPDVRLPDGSIGQAVSVDTHGQVTVARADGDVVTLASTELGKTDLPEPSAVDLALPVEDNPDVSLPAYLTSYLKTVVEGAVHPVEHGSYEEHLATTQMEAMFKSPAETVAPWQLAQLPDGRYGQALGRPDDQDRIQVLVDSEVLLLPRGDLMVAGPPPYLTSYDDHAERHVWCSAGHKHWGAAGAAGVLVRNKGRDGQDRYLLQLRAPWVQHGNTWSTPGGAMHIGEDPEQAATREATEELGELPDGITTADVFSDDHGGWGYHTVVLDSPTRFDTDSGDREGLRTGWFTAAEMADLPLHPSFRDSWPALLTRLGDETAAGDASPHPEDAGTSTLAPTWSDDLEEPMAATAAVRAAVAEGRNMKGSAVPVADMNTALAAMLARAGIPFDPTAEPSMLAGEHAAKAGQTGDGAKARAMIPTVEQLIDKGMGAEEAAKEWKRLYNNARFRVRDARLKAVKAGQVAVEQDKETPAPPKVSADVLAGEDITALVDTIAAAVIADIDQKQGKPKALYTLDVEEQLTLQAAGKFDGPGPGGMSPSSRWQNYAKTLEAGDEIPVVGVWIQGHKVAHGTVFKFGETATLPGAVTSWPVADPPPILIEHDPTDDPEAVKTRAVTMAMRFARATKDVKPELRALQTGLAWLTDDSPADAHWAEVYGIEHFKSAATGGDGSSTLWNVEPTVGMLAHEFGHNVDRRAPSSGGRLTSEGDPAGFVKFDALPQPPETADPKTPPMDSSFAQARGDDAAWAARWETLLGDRTFTEARHGPGDHTITFATTETAKDGSVGVPTDYGRSSISEDFAESVRLYLKDRSLGRLGYLSPEAGQTSGPVLRFADMWPARARYLDVVFGNAPVTDTAWQKAQHAAIVKVLIAATHDDDEWAVSDGSGIDAGWPHNVDLEMSFAVDALVVEAARAQAVTELTAELKDLQAKAAAEAAAAAKKLAAEQAAAAELAAKAKAAADLITAALDDAAKVKATLEPADPQAVAKIRKRKAWVKWNARQTKTVPIVATGEGGYWTAADFKVKKGGKLLVKKGDTLQWANSNGLLFRGTPIEGGKDDGGGYLVFELPIQVGILNDVTGVVQWSDADGVKVYMAPPPGPANVLESTKIPAPGSLVKVVKEGHSEADAIKISEAYEAEALEALGASVAGAKGIPSAPPEVAGLSDKQVGAIIAGAQDAYDEAKKAQVLTYGDAETTVNDAIEAGGPELAALLEGNNAKGQVFNGHETLLGPFTSSVDSHGKLWITVGSQKFPAESFGSLEVYLPPGDDAQAAIARQDYIVNAVIQALADPGSDADHGAPSGTFNNASRRKGGSWLKKAGLALHQNAKAQSDDSMQAKANIAAELGSRLNNEADWELFRNYRRALKGATTGDKYGSVPFDVAEWKDTTPAQRAAILDQEASNRVGGWAGTSGDTNPWAIAMQRAVAEEFATGGNWNPHGMSMSAAMSGAGSKSLQEAWDDGLGVYLRRFARVMWENTQAEFAAEGVTHVSLYRGMKVYGGKSGEWAVPGEHPVTDLMPANSWSTARATAISFSGSGMVLAAEFPASRILGTARTGFGCKNEYEFVVLNGPGNVTVYHYSSPDLPKAS